MDDAEQSLSLHSLLQRFEKEVKLVAAICAAPIALRAAGIGHGKTLTSHPCVEEELASVYKYSTERVVVDGQLVTRWVI
jgi:putative intracellular protease/amidase